MKSNYKVLGGLIKQVSERNTNLLIKTLQGISIEKEFMPSVANVVGTDMSNYKVVRKGQFAYNPMHVGRDEVLPIRLLEGEESIMVSPAYTVFDILDQSLLLPEYLMMWFSRSEFDRKAWFTTDSSVRGGFSWESLCEIKIPLPDKNKQEDVVKKYNILLNHIALNNQLIKQIEEAAGAVYKLWFIDFEFPNEDGNPYKSNGGEMEFNEELGEEIPKGWSVETLVNCQKVIRGFGSAYIEVGNIKSLNQKVNKGEYLDTQYYKYLRDDVVIPKEKFAQKYDILLNSLGQGTLGRVHLYMDIDERTVIDQHISIIRNIYNKLSPIYLYLFLSSKKSAEYFESIITGSTGMQMLNINDVRKMPILIPGDKLMDTFQNLLEPLYSIKENFLKQNESLVKFKHLQLSIIASQNL